MILLDFLSNRVYLFCLFAFTNTILFFVFIWLGGIIFKHNYKLFKVTYICKQMLYGWKDKHKIKCMWMMKELLYKTYIILCEVRNSCAPVTTNTDTSF